uniref:ADP-ribosylation factor-like protein 2-binding protein isoform X3 n=1 Tax=Myxine glutinosa TaxID=7769 RepID=UPI00358E20C1
MIQSGAFFRSRSSSNPEQGTKDLSMETEEDGYPDEDIFLLCEGEQSEFDCIIGHIEDIIMGETFRRLQVHFMDKHCSEFDNSEENKLCYTLIFQEYQELMEQLLERELKRRLPEFHMSRFLDSLEQRQQEVMDDVLEVVFTCTDFLAFKQRLLEHRAHKEGRDLNLGDDMVKSLAPSASALP